MKTILSVALAVLPAAVSAQAYQGAAVELHFQKYETNNGFDLTSVEGNLDALWQLGGSLGVQAGLTLGKQIDSSDDIDLQQYNAVSLHLTADASDALRFGLLVSADNQADGIALVAGEALYLAGPLRVEGRLGDSFDKDFDYTLFEVNGSYAVTGPLAVRFGTSYSDFGDNGFYRVFTLGAGYTLGSGTEVYADLSRHTNDFGASDPQDTGSIVDIGVRFDLGAGDTGKAFRYQPLK